MSNVSIRNRIKSSQDILEIKNSGKSFSDSNLVLIVKPNNLGFSRYTAIASKAVGGAVSRNRCKRRLRNRADRMLEMIPCGIDFLLIARLPLLQVSPLELDRSMTKLFKRAGLLEV